MKKKIFVWLTVNFAYDFEWSEREKRFEVAFDALLIVLEQAHWASALNFLFNFSHVSLHNLAFRFKLCVELDRDDIRGSKMWSKTPNWRTTKVKRGKIMIIIKCEDSVYEMHYFVCNCTITIMWVEAKSTHHFRSPLERRSKNIGLCKETTFGRKRCPDDWRIWNAPFGYFFLILLNSSTVRELYSRYH